MRIGNWRITEDAIQWAGKGLQRFVIDKEVLLDITKVAPTYEDMYKCILLATEEDWLTADDLYDLNFAFVFAAGKWQEEMDYETFDRTVAYEFDLLDEEEETQP